MSDVTARGFSRARLARIDRFLRDRYVGPGVLPCAQLLIARRGELVHQSVIGQQDPERNTPLAEDSLYRIYSMTKPITSVALMSLVEEGLIALDDPVAKHIPHWADLGVFQAGVAGGFVTVPPARPMQVVDLMRHTSGLTYGFQYRSNVDAAYRKAKIELMHGGRDLEGMIAELANLPLEFSPGEAWNYSVATDVCGWLVQTVTGKPLDQVFRERIFEPLQMRDTGFFVREDQRDRFTACYEAQPDGRRTLQDDARTSPFLAPPTLLSGGGGLVSTAADYLRFVEMLRRGGEHDGGRLLGLRTVAHMTRNHLPGNADLATYGRPLFAETPLRGVGFGLGFATVIDQARYGVVSSLGEYNWGGAASTAFFVDPVEDMTVTFYTQLIPSSTLPVRTYLRSLVYQALVD